MDVVSKLDRMLVFDAPGVHRSDHNVAGAERTMSKHGASFCSTFVLVFGQDEKKGQSED
mgnify:CR=1